MVIYIQTYNNIYEKIYVEDIILNLDFYVKLLKQYFKYHMKVAVECFHK